MQPLTTAEAATLKHVARSTIIRACNEGRLTATKHGRDWVIAQADLEAWTPAHPRTPSPGKRSVKKKKPRRVASRQGKRGRPPAKLKGAEMQATKAGDRT